ncbi:FYVE zinc finger [Dillenia turbinata]|uniref:FYVE zinc finger n=1 Tax=Dillenia turbinata TaxID=194707 RepID=A0AAN8VMQ9_9MAGN
MVRNDDFCTTSGAEQLSSPKSRVSSSPSQPSDFLPGNTVDKHRESVIGFGLQDHQVVEKHQEHTKSVNMNDIWSEKMTMPAEYDSKFHGASVDRATESSESNGVHEKKVKYFSYDSPHSEETGVWIPISVPPMSESEHEEWSKGFCSNGGFFPEVDMGWGQYSNEDKELTAWDVVSDMLLAARGKVSSLASGDICGSKLSWVSSHLLEQAWKEMAQTLTEANFANMRELIDSEPPKWLADSAASACMLCGTRFHPIMCSRHHCRFCGGIFCNDCSKGRSLMPAKFRVEDPQRVCDVCCVRLESIRSVLMDQVSRAAQLPTHDVTDLSTLRSWANIPWRQSMEYEIYKATNTIRVYSKIGSLRPEKSIPDAVLQGAKGLAILTAIKVGTVITYRIGTGLVVARRDDGSWSPPSAISSLGLGWGIQAGGELIDFIIVLRTENALKTFGSNMHFSFGAGLSASLGIVGRAVEADLRAGDGGYAACYTYSCSKGAFAGCSLEGSIITTRGKENSRFYGSQTLTAPDILLGSLPMPPAAAILYRALADLYQKIEG